MKILIIQHTDIIGGSLNGAIELVKSLKAICHNDIIELYVQGKRKSREIISQREGISILDQDFGVQTFDFFNGGNGFARTLVKYCMGVKNIRHWRTFLNKERYDVVILNTSVLWPLCSVILESGSKCVCYVRETIKGSPYSLINTFIRKRISKCTKVLFLTEFDKEQWNVPMNPEDQYVVPETVFITDKNVQKKAIRKKLLLNDNVFYVLFMGGMQKIKGTDIIIQTMKILKEQGYENKIHLLLLGDCGRGKRKIVYNIKYHNKVKYQKFWNEYIEKFQLAGMILECGYQNNIYEWLSACDIVVFPVTSVHQARPIYEAGAVKKTIILSDFPNYRDNITDGKNGIVFKKGDAKDLFEKIIYLFNDRALLNKLGNSNYDMVKDNHSREVIQIILQNLINGIKNDI